MKIRAILRLVIFVVACVVHFWFQWYAWKVHLGEIPDGLGTRDRLWQILSFPVFTLTSRRTQHLHFYDLLAVNSVLWGAVTAWATVAALARLFKGIKRWWAGKG